MKSILSIGSTWFRSLPVHARFASRSLVGAFLVGTVARAQSPTLVKDIQPGVSATASPSATFGSILGVSGGRAFLTGADEEGDPGVWVTDGTVAGTHRLLRLVQAESGADINGTLFFSAATPEGSSLWKTDGTVAGTVLAYRFTTGPTVFTKAEKLTKVGSRLFFAFDDGVHGAELWTSDGTATGTRLVKDATPGPTGSFFYEGRAAVFVEVGGTLFYSCTGNYGLGLWKSDGTEAGTVQISDVTSVSSLVNVNGTLYFTAFDSAHGVELWKSDGTVAGTLLVRDIVPGLANSAPSSLVPFGGELYFRLGSDGSTWKSDGTEAGTVLVHSFPSSDPFVPSGASLFTVSGTQLWASDGTAAGTALVRDFGVPVSLSTAATIPGALLLWADRGADGLELWRSNCTPAGTTLVAVVEPGNESPSAWRSATIPGASIHIIGNAAGALWRSDGTPAGTFAVQEPRFRPNDSNPGWFTDVNGTLLFSATDADHGNELWKSDGTPGGTTLVKDLVPGPAGSGPNGLFATRTKVFFFANAPETGYELYRTDGTEQGTWLIKDILPGPLSGHEVIPAILGELLVFASDDSEHGTEPWRSDGTPDGTFLLGDLTPGPAPSQVGLLGALNGTFYLSASDGTTTTLWRTDGTTTGTVAIGPLPGRSWAGDVIGGSLVFGASDPTHGGELWTTDGTAPGTALLLDINPSGDSWPSIVGRLQDRLFFWADDGAHGIEPWVTDGTSAGTNLLKDINPGPARSNGIGWKLLGSTLYFFANDGVHGYELWRSDGTPAGTVLVNDVTEGPQGSMFYDFFTGAGDEVFFTASAKQSGRELWRSDGTEAGTTLVSDLRPGLENGTIPLVYNSHRSVLARSGGRVFFTANDGTTGHELWTLPVPMKLHTVVPCRVADTRDPAGPTGGAPLAASATLVLQVTGRCGIPATAISLAANVTAVSPSATGSLSIFAGGPIVSGSTEVPVTAGKTRALHLLPNLGTSGTLSVRPLMPPGSDTHVILDVSGYFE